MSNPNPLAKITNFVAKNVIVSSAVAILSILILGSVIAQAFAPDNLKPFKMAKSESSSSSVSSSISSSSLSSVSSTSSVVSSSANPSSSTPTVKTQTYTNQYFPDFKLVYPEDWKFETSTQPSSYDLLLKRDITLTKNQYQIKFSTKPNDKYDSCDGGGLNPPYNIDVSKKFTNGLSKFTLTQDSQSYLFYGENKGIGCKENKYLQTNLKSKDYPKYLETIQNAAFVDNKELVSYSINISVSSNNGKTYLVNSNDPMISQIDQIISQSSFK